MKYWELIADRLSKSGWSWGCVAVVSDAGREVFVVDAQRDEGKRYVVRSDEKLTAFLEMARITRDANECGSRGSNLSSDRSAHHFGEPGGS
jgi:hypothetical protein